MANEVQYSANLTINNATTMAFPKSLGFETLYGDCTTGKTAGGTASIGSSSAALAGVTSPAFGIFKNNDSIASVILLDAGQTGNPTIAVIRPGAGEFRNLWAAVNLYALGSPSATTAANFEYLISGQ